MRSASVVSELAWQVNERGAHALEVVLRKATYVLPWSQFLYAEGGEDEVRLLFATHDVVVKGSGLGALLTDVASHRLAALAEPISPGSWAAVRRVCVKSRSGRPARGQIHEQKRAAENRSVPEEVLSKTPSLSLRLSKSRPHWLLGNSLNIQ